MRYYFLGIGGIGMSALARYFKQRGDSVSGYDHTPSALTAALEREGIAVHYDDDPAKIPADVDLCIYTPAVPTTTAVFIAMRQRGIAMKKRSQVLGEIARGKRCIAVAGSHGKTTTTGLIFTLLQAAGQPVSTFLGGIHKNLHSNMHYDDASTYVVVEADEYDRSFLQLQPYLAVVTATDADHLDIYGTHQAMLEAFDQFARQTADDGYLFINRRASILQHQSSYIAQCVATGRGTLYGGTDGGASHYATNLRIERDTIVFDYHSPQQTIANLQLHSALYNVENAVAAISVAERCGVDADAIRRGIAAFAGIERRFDYRVNGSIVYIDDYAHHPRELSAVIDSVRRLYSGRRIAGIFQPHLYSRTRDFYADFAAALSALDDVTLLDIYPAREEPIAGVSSQLIYERLTCPTKRLCSKEELVRRLDEIEADVLLTLGAGDIDRLVPSIAEYITARAAKHTPQQ